MKRPEKEERALREPRPWMVIAGAASFLYCLLRFEDLLFALVGLVIGAICALLVVRFYAARRGSS